MKQSMLQIPLQTKIENTEIRIKTKATDIVTEAAKMKRLEKKRFKKSEEIPTKMRGRHKSNGRHTVDEICER